MNCFCISYKWYIWNFYYICVKPLTPVISRALCSSTDNVEFCCALPILLSLKYFNANLSSPHLISSTHNKSNSQNNFLYGKFPNKISSQLHHNTKSQNPLRHKDKSNSFIHIGIFWKLRYHYNYFEKGFQFCFQFCHFFDRWCIYHICMQNYLYVSMLLLRKIHQVGIFNGLRHHHSLCQEENLCSNSSHLIHI